MRNLNQNNLLRSVFLFKLLVQCISCINNFFAALIQLVCCHDRNISAMTARLLDCVNQQWKKMNAVAAIRLRWTSAKNCSRFYIAQKQRIRRYLETHIFLVSKMARDRTSLKRYAEPRILKLSRCLLILNLFSNCR